MLILIRTETVVKWWAVRWGPVPGDNPNFLLADNPPAIAGFRSGALVSAKRGLPANEIAPHKCFVLEKSAPPVGAQSVISCLDRQYYLPIDGLGSPRQISQ